MSQNDNADHRLRAATDIVAAYLANNKSSVSEVESMLERIYGKLVSLEQGGSETRASASLPSGVDVASSITPDYIICLEDGKKLKMLKRYLKTNFDMTPEDYRKRWNLPSSYPMVAPNYAKKRSRLAKEIGLGRKPGGTAKAKAKPVKTMPKSTAKLKGELPKGKGRLNVVKSTDMMKANVRT